MDSVITTLFFLIVGLMVLKLVAVWVLVQLAGATVAQLIAHALRRRGPGP